MEPDTRGATTYDNRARDVTYKSQKKTPSQEARL